MLLAAPAPAAETRVASYCSPSGDVCYGVFGRRRRVYLRITTAAGYFHRYTLCVQLLPAGSGGAEHARRRGSLPLFPRRAVAPAFPSGHSPPTSVPPPRR